MITREDISIGEYADDKKGDFLRNAGEKMNNNFKNLFSYLNGGLSEATIPTDRGLPIVRGGTGGVTVASALKNLGIFRDVNGKLFSGMQFLTLSHTAITSSNDTAPTVSNPTIGEYVLTGFNGFPTGYQKFAVPEDDYGNPKCCVVPLLVEEDLTLKIYASTFINGFCEPDLLMPLSLEDIGPININSK